MPRWETAVKIARAAGRPLDWFAPSDWAHSLRHVAENLGDVTYALGRELQGQAARAGEDFVFLPLYDVRASAGHGAWNDAERVSKLLAFRRDWLRAATRATTGELALLYIDGDSMEPTLRDSDVVMIDRSQVEVRADSIFVLQDDGALLVKRLQRLTGGRLRIASDNPRYASQEIEPAQLDPEHGTLRVIGRVVWAGVKM